jgi:UDP-N-acetylglucosamine 2-epimerase
MKSMKVLTVVGTRPEVIRLSRVIACLDKYIEHVLVHTGQNYDYELNEIFFQDLEIRKPNYFLDAATDSVAGTIGSIISWATPTVAFLQFQQSEGRYLYSIWRPGIGALIKGFPRRSTESW